MTYARLKKLITNGVYVKEDMMSELHTQTKSDCYKEAVTWKI